MDALYKSGFAFFRDHGNGIIEFENIYTGLRILYDVKHGTRVVKED